MESNRLQSKSENTKERKIKLHLASHLMTDFQKYFSDETYLLYTNYKQMRDAERRLRVQRIQKFLYKGEDLITFELGCKLGQMTIPLQHITKGSVIGLERDNNSVKECTARDEDNKLITYLFEDFMFWEIPEDLIGKVDQIVASNFFHEIYSQYGLSGFHQSLEKCNLLLKKSGKLIIMDGFHPENDLVLVKFKDQPTIEQFIRFTCIFSPVNIRYRSIDHQTIEVFWGDFARFLNCLKFLVPDDVRDYELTLNKITERKEKISRAYHILHFYTQPKSNFEPEFQQDFPFFSEREWIASMNHNRFQLEFRMLYNERKVENSFWNSGIKLINSYKYLPQSHILVVGRK